MKSTLPKEKTPKKTRKEPRRPDLMDKVFAGFDTGAKDIILPILRRTQEVFGYIPEEAVFEIGKRLKLSPAHLYGVATFYDQFTLKPQGRHVIRLCTNMACNILGAESLLEQLSGRLGIKKGGTTRDGRFTLLEVECIGACGSGPAMMINDDFHYHLTEKNIDKILARYK